jgi:hypothetical protein
VSNANNSKIILGLFIGEITFVIGLLSTALYFGVYYGASFFHELLGLNLYSSRWLLGFCVFLTFSGVFMQISSMRIALRGKDFFFSLFSTSTAAVSLGIVVYRTMLFGFDWIGKELFRNQALAKHSAFNLLGIFILVYTFLFFVYSGTLVTGGSKNE